jgi:hypothetical protein
MWLCKSDVMSDVMSRDDKGRHYGMQNDQKNWEKWVVSLQKPRWHWYWMAMEGLWQNLVSVLLPLKRRIRIPMKNHVSLNATLCL